MNILNFFKKIQPASLSRTILHVGMSTVLVYLLALLFTLNFSTLPSYILAHVFSPALEHIIMSATITVVGALLVELTAFYN